MGNSGSGKLGGGSSVKKAGTGKSSKAKGREPKYDAFAGQAWRKKSKSIKSSPAPF
jgi:hypothetical protein